MSFYLKPANHNFIHVYLAASELENNNNYGDTSNGFPYDTVKESIGSLNWNDTTKIVTVNKDGLYLVAYGYSLRNQTSTTDTDIINFGISHYNSDNGITQNYVQEVSAEWFGTTVRQSISNSFVIKCSANDTIRGTITNRNATQVIEGGIGRTYMSIGLITAYN